MYTADRTNQRYRYFVGDPKAVLILMFMLAAAGIALTYIGIFQGRSMGAKALYFTLAALSFAILPCLIRPYRFLSSVGGMGQIQVTDDSLTVPVGSAGKTVTVPVNAIDSIDARNVGLARKLTVVAPGHPRIMIIDERLVSVAVFDDLFTDLDLRHQAATSNREPVPRILCALCLGPVAFEDSLQNGNNRVCPRCAPKCSDIRS